MTLEGLKEAHLKDVLAEINETGNKYEENCILVKEWIRYQTHLPYDTYDERILNLFLRGCKHDLARIKLKLDTYFTVKTVYPDLFRAWDPCSAQVQQSLDHFNVVPLPKLTPDGYRVTLHRFVTSDTSKFDPKQVFRSMFMIGDVRLAEEPAIVGDVFLFDVANMTAGHLAKLAQPILKNTLYCVQNAYPQRLKEIHLFNAPPLIDRVVTFFKQFLKEKMRNRFYIHINHDTLYKYVPRSHLPKEYGGELKSTIELQGLWYKKLRSYKTYFDEQSSVRSDESRRQGKQSHNLDQTLYGYEGAFRKLNID